MKSALVILNYPLQNQIVGGSIDLLKIQFENMLNTFDEVYVISPRDARKYNLDWDKKIKIHSTGCDKKHSYYFSPISDLIYTLRLIKNKKIKIIRALAPSSGFIAVLAGKLTSTPTIVSIHTDRKLVAKADKENKIKHFLLDFVERWTYTNANLVPVVSKHVGDCVRKVAPFAKLFLHYNFVDTDLFKPIPHKNKVPVLIFVGRLIKSHGAHLAIAALPEILKKQKVILKICGDGPERENLVLLAEKLGVKKYVKFLGFVDHTKRLPYELGTSNIFVSPGLSGFTLIEALACVLPVVAADVEWSKEVINTNNGILIPVNHNTKLAEGVIKLLSKNGVHLCLDRTGLPQTINKFSMCAWKKRESEVYVNALRN